ncbi:MAG: hypothetical protein WEA56_09430 [Balneolaceae bacterium]
MRSFFIILVSTWFLNLILPWWSVVIPALLTGAWFFDRGLRAFCVGFTAAGFAWLLPALYIHFANDAILSTRIAEMMQVGSPWILLIITFLIGGLAGGLSALLGFMIKVVFRPESTPPISDDTTA